MGLKFIGLDVGERRVGVAVGDLELKMAWPHSTILVDDDFAHQLLQIIESEGIEAVVVGLPRNQKGEPTGQTEFTKGFVGRELAGIKLPIHWQDESVTSAVAEQRLKDSGKPYAKEDIDSQAAAIILQDFLEAQ